VLQYAKSLEDLRRSAEEDMDVAKRKDGLDWVNVDPAQLKPKMIWVTMQSTLVSVDVAYIKAHMPSDMVSLFDLAMT